MLSIIVLNRILIMPGIFNLCMILLNLKAKLVANLDTLVGQF